ncbi:hypothetical protein Ancab_037393 [Ancistrocladus abbreviatus]
MRGSGDFLTDFLKNDIGELDGLVYDEETDAMFVDICKGICSIKESDPIPSSIKLSGDFSIDLIEGDEIQKVDDAVYNEETEVTFLGICKTKCNVKALEPASNNEIKSKIAASRRKLKEGKNMIPLNFKDHPKPKGRGVHREPTMLVDIRKNICDIEESHSTPSATKQSCNLLMDFLEDEEVQEVYDAVYNEETEAIFLGICKTICDVKAPEPASNSQIESKIEASWRKLKEGGSDFIIVDWDDNVALRYICRTEVCLATLLTGIAGSNEGSTDHALTIYAQIYLFSSFIVPVALACLSGHKALKHCAFSRGLQYDVSLAVAWACLGKEFDRARSIDPSLALPWAGMSADVPTRESITDEVYKNCLRAVQIMLVVVDLGLPMDLRLLFVFFPDFSGFYYLTFQDTFHHRKYDNDEDESLIW